MAKDQRLQHTAEDFQHIGSVHNQVGGCDKFSGDLAAELNQQSGEQVDESRRPQTNEYVGMSRDEPWHGLRHDPNSDLPDQKTDDFWEKADQGSKVYGDGRSVPRELGEWDGEIDKSIGRYYDESR